MKKTLLAALVIATASFGSTAFAQTTGGSTGSTMVGNTPQTISLTDNAGFFGDVIGANNAGAQFADKFNFSVSGNTPMSLNAIISSISSSASTGLDVTGLALYEDLGAGDQGHMFGYASNETPELMPLTHSLATKLAQKLSDSRKDGTCPWLRPDAKTQVTVEYKDVNGKPVPQRVHTVVISAQHSPDVDNDFIRKELKEKIILPTIPSQYLDDNLILHLNPSGRFVIGGPQGDAGTTGRKIIVDTYGGWGAHGGGAFSGKDPTKVDRSAAYACRWIAKSLVAAGLADRVLVQVSYSIGIAEPMSLFVNSYGTGKKSDAELLEIVKKNFDLRPGMIIKELQLRRPIYRKTASFGHFGREDPDFLWEQPKSLVY